MGHIWREYGRADARWAVKDTTVLSIEIATVFVGLLCVLEIVAISKRWSIAHPLQIVIAVAELYGGWMTFAPEWLSGSPNLDGSTFTLLYIYLIFMNGLWLVVPGVLLWESFAVTSHTTGAVAPAAIPYSVGYPPAMAFYIVAILLVVYNILVPAVLFSADGVPVAS